MAKFGRAWYTFSVHLSRLEINGFKSFGEKIVLEFTPGVTGIVGPNGSGKSNIVDGIRWVLGEQGYKGIRLEKSDDVIFLGSHGKGGRGKMSRASVEMLLKNIPQDRGVPYDEFSIARHVYRDGEGEYFMNKAQVRLKDSLEMLARLHVSTKNYSIVTQGMSDQLLRFSPQELRATVEDASGVKEWQLKKRDAERKLVKSGEHALQVQALLAELRPYLNNLRNQMKRWERRDEFARRVQELKELKVFVRSRTLLHDQLERDARRQKLQQNIRQLEETKKQLTLEVAGMEKQIRLENTSSGNAPDTKLQELYEKRMALERELIKVESQLASFSASPSRSMPDAQVLLEKISEVKKLLVALENAQNLDVVKAGIRDALGKIQALEKLFEKESAIVPQEIRDAQLRIKESIVVIERELDAVKKQGRESRAKEQQLKDTFFQKERTLRKIEDDLDRALREEAAFMDGLKTAGGAVEAVVKEARTALPDAPSTLEGLVKVLEVSYGGRDLPEISRIEEELIRATTRLADIGDLDPQIKSEYDKTDERFNFLSKELTDVQHAKSDLEKLIVDLEGEIQRKFEESFVGVNKEFGKYMETIFGGGKGELLKLVPPRRRREVEEDEGEGEEDAEEEKEGIVVHVELPGKRIKSLELLSGGERALTSIAFLFALISTIKPPFVVLDEVDAALDEANSRRFANLLESVKAQTQCIVVTHNRSTMSVAEALYGVTMGGDGISRILSLKLGA